LELHIENVRTYQTAPPGLRVTHVYIESVRSRPDAPIPSLGSGGAYRPLLQVSI
jgi:hypothetical protein